MFSFALGDMNNFRSYIAIWGLTFAATGVAAEATKYLLVGAIPAVCPITIKRNAVDLPSSFRITAEEAVRRAAAETNVKCNNIFDQLVYADSENYYIIKSILGPINDKTEAVVINAATGKVTIRK